MKLQNTFYALSTFLALNIALTAAVSDGDEVLLVCGDQRRFCGWEDIVVAPLTEIHEVRCCSDEQITNWKKKSNCAVYAQSRLLPVGGGDATCHHEASYTEAVGICEANNARLCTSQELLDRCTVGSGCGHDHDHVWSSTVATEGMEFPGPPEPKEPLVLPADSKVYLACGDHKNRKGCGNGLHTNVAELTETHEVRCCSDSTISGWTKRNGCNVWGQSKLFDEDGNPQCHHATTFDQAASICALNGARLCSKTEILGRCTRGSGCGHDRDLVWTSTVAPANAVAVKVANTLTQPADPPVCLGPTGGVSGDPHVKTFDGLRYDCQGKGEFVLAMSKGTDPLAIHGRFVGGDWTAKPTVTRSVAFKVHEDVPVVQVSVPDEPDDEGLCSFSFTIGKEELGIETNGVIDYFNKTYHGQANVYTNGRNYVFTYPDYGARIQVSAIDRFKVFGCFMNVNVCLTPEKHGGADNIVGLLGSPNGNKADDWMESSKEGSIVPIPSFERKNRDLMQQGHDYCVANWCVGSSDDSLYGVENFNTYNNCAGSSFDADELIKILDNLPEVIKKGCDDTEDGGGCEVDVALEIDGNDEDPQTVVDEVVQELVEEDAEAAEIRDLTEDDLDGGVGDWIGPVITSSNLTQTPPEENNEANTQTSTNSGTKGDPHFKTWHQEHFEYHGQCDLILVKDPEFADGLGLEIQIRTKLVRFWSYIKTAAIRIGDDILEVEGNGDKLNPVNHYWLNLEYQGELKTFGGFPLTVWAPASYKRSFEIDLSSKYPGQKIVIQYFKEFVSVDFKNGTKEAFGNTVGLLGDFKTGQTFARDGSTVLDDFSELGNEWQVLPFENMLFHDVEQPQFPKRCIEPENPRGERRRRRLGEETVSEDEAEKACASIKDPRDRKDCIYDILATQDLEMVGAY